MRRSLLATCCATALLAAGCSAGSAADPKISVPAAAPAEGLATTGTAKPETPGFTVVATGDVLIHPALTDQATQDGGGKRDYRQIFAGVKPVISAADLAICHLETPIAAPEGPFKGYPEFSAPPEVADALADAGYDDCSTASNHTLDVGEAGVTRTLAALDKAGIKHTGSARSADEAKTPLILDVKGTKVGQVSYTFGFNGKQLPAGKPWMSNTLKADDVITAAKAAKAAGAEVVIASLHWGTEFVHDPTQSQRRDAQKLLSDPNIDLIIGHHAHVVQPFEKINGKWVAYGLGNHIAKHSDPRGVSEEGAIARFHFTRGGTGWTVDKAEYLPTLISLGPPIRLLDLTQGSAGDSRQTEAVKRTEGIVLSRDARNQGLTRPGN
ncbi:CapA family protein [Kibdelosporangium phytohabitans]|uniref:Poly-gamma-glutamate biosynthesis protein n=1 Tax=Kibdelosporangium phytohabitans TaxID=860235 RepID=A0A0N9HW23_9PSEU|nr:CapA family protein [Kibdelosporangium phytohabitans]ALG05990.1 poly-gamma-glutamate biosynthesis protein [Kibdelosporangium phytohabitans]MBE1465948.1 poly-gamma-glutamate synthesis protein (capsule biosynthesis protein) [Kibdelosporangium phytohabitans]